MTATDEQWRPVVGYEGLYEVSDQGRVRSLGRVAIRRGYPLRIPGRVLRPTPGDAGRVCIRLFNRDGVKKTLRVSVLVLAAFVGPRPEGLDGCHNNGDPTDNRLSNLRWDTRSANARDAVRHGTNNEVRKMHCPRKHPLVAPNLAGSHARRGRRTCLACHRALCARRRAKIKGEPFDMQREADERYEAILRAA